MNAKDKNSSVNKSYGRMKAEQMARDEKDWANQKAKEKRKNKIGSDRRKNGVYP